jgi:hypothetical protein
MPNLETVLHIASILSVISTGAAVLWRLSGFFVRVELTFKRLAENAERHTVDDAAVAARHAAEIADVRDRLDKIADAMTTLAVQKEQIAGLRIDLSSVRADVADMRHGRGGP